MTNTTVGVFSTHREADQAISALRSLGVDKSDLSYLYVDSDSKMQDDMSDSKVGKGLAEGATTGAVIGAAAGLIVANGILPGLGTLFVAGPVATALGLTGAAATTVAGAATGLAAGSILGALVGVGVSREDAEMYEGFLEKGDVIVVTKSDDLVTKEVFENEGAKEIREYVAT